MKKIEIKLTLKERLFLMIIGAFARNDFNGIEEYVNNFINEEDTKAQIKKLEELRIVFGEIAREENNAEYVKMYAKEIEFRVMELLVAKLK